MTKEIAGLTYSREPRPGETVKVRMQECGNYISAMVWAGSELIAFDNISKPSKPDREDAARHKRETLARRAAKHWAQLGLTVDTIL